MKKQLLLLLLTLFSITFIRAQSKLDKFVGPGRSIYCPPSDPNAPAIKSYVAPPLEYLLKQNKAAKVTADKSKFIVTYNDFPADAKAAFQKAVDIWQSILVSDVPIRITANWQSLGTSVLGSATTTGAYRDFPGAAKAQTWYAVALAEKMAHTNLNGDRPDIVAQFNGDFAWYYGLDGNVPANRYDLVSVVLHEIGHGLGFFGSLREASSDATLGVITDGGVPYIYDVFVESQSGQRLLNSSVFKNPSAELHQQLVGGQLYMNTPSIIAVNDSLRGRLYAPNPYDEGSSYSHWDEVTYRTGTVNALMSPQFARAEAIHNPGPMMLGLFNDMGWVGNTIAHKRLKDSEDLVNPLAFNVKVFGDNGFDSTSVKLVYSYGDITKDKTEVLMTRNGKTGEYAFSLPNKGSEQTLSYYFTAVDSQKKTFSTPAEAPGSIANINFYKVRIAADTVKPVIDFVHNISLVKPSDTQVNLPSLTVADNIDIDTVYVEFLIDGKAQPAFALTRGQSSDLLSGGIAYPFTGKFTFASGLFKGGEKIQYRIVVKDKTKAKNTVYSPSTGYYEFSVQKILAAVNSYITTFESVAADDFFTKGFSITQPSGFASKSMHSDHPYKDGTEFAFTASDPSDTYSNFTFNLQKPIILRGDTAKIYFDEIVLVEPGDRGVAFASNGVPNRNFYDYVIVEGSKDGGNTWKWFQDGWDSSSNSAWLAAWNSSSDANGNSLATGTPALFKPREIDMLKSGDFKAGDQVLIRFRLLADVGAHGWGWAVDNLNIQGPNPNPPKVVVLGTEFDETQLFTVSPNPSNTGQFLLKATFEKPATKLRLSVANMLGQEISQANFEKVGTEFSQIVDLSSASSGTYILRMMVDDKLYVKKLISHR